MNRLSRFTRVKIVAGYLLLLSGIFFSLLFIRKELQNLSVLDTEQLLKTDSLLILLREKDENTLNMLRLLNDANEKLLSVTELEEIIARQDTVIVQQRVQQKIVISSDSVATPIVKKGFFRRLGEVFVPSKDTVVMVNTTQEVTTDTLLNAYNPIDSLQEHIREASRQKREEHQNTIRRNNARMRRANALLTARIDSLIKEYQQEIILQATQEAENQQEIRRRSITTIGTVAAGAIILSAIFLIIIWRDITRSNRYRRELEIANQRAAELLKARENLMLAITHDFKAPLGSIIGYIDLLIGSGDIVRQDKSYLDNMKASSDHLLKLVNDLLDFHRLDLNKTEVNRITFNPAKLFAEICISFKPLIAAKELSFSYEIAPELNGEFISDPLRIKQIVNNLLSNAVKFTPRGNISLLVDYSLSQLTVQVIDTGKGMKSGDQERIFREFTRLPDAQGEEGFGLGLSIVKKLVDLLQGTINVTSQTGKGSTFTLCLPLYPASGRTKREESEHLLSKTGNGTSSLKVLIIDDDKIQLDLTAAMLRQEGITAVCCDQLDTLIDHLRTEEFDILLTDLQMPAMSGFDLLALLRSSNIVQAQTIPVIAVTARSEIAGSEFKERGFSGYLNKPFAVNDLFRMIGLAEKKKEHPERFGYPDVENLNFQALTAFSVNDEAAAKEIMNSFVMETCKNADRMQQAFDLQDVSAIAYMAHKLLPLFTLIGAEEVTSLLLSLEGQKENVFSEQIKATTGEALGLIYNVIRQAEQYKEVL